MSNKGIIIAVIIFVVLAIADVISTLMVGQDLIQYLETNPLYKLIGLSGLFVLNLGVAGAFYLGYHYTAKTSTRYSLILCLVMISLLRVFIVINNLRVASNPPSVEDVKYITEEFKINYYFYKVILPAVMYYVPGMFAFMLFKKDHVIKPKED